MHNLTIKRFVEQFNFYFSFSFSFYFYSYGFLFYKKIGIPL